MDDTAKAWLRGDIKEGSPHDLEARRTIARMLRSEDVGLIRILADAIDPDNTGSSWIGRLIMKPRGPGRRQRVEPRRIAAFVYQRTKAGVPVESAVAEAERKFAVKSSTVYTAWTKWRPHIERNPELWGRI
jgi:hypothetical protein